MTQARQRHARFYLEYARANPEDWQWFDAEWLQIKRAWDMLNACDDSTIEEFLPVLVDFLTIRGKWQEIIAWGQKALQTASASGNPETQARVHQWIGNAYSHSGQHRLALEHYRSALEIVRQTGTNREYFQRAILMNLGNAHAYLGDYRQAIVSYEEALVLIRQSRDQKLECRCLLNLGNVLAQQDAEKARDHFEQALSLARKIGDRQAEASTLGNMANLVEDVSRQVEYLQEALRISRNIGDVQSEIRWLGNLGNAYAAVDLNQALAYVTEAISIARQVSDCKQENFYLCVLAEVYMRAGQPQQAIQILENRLSIAQQNGYEIDDIGSYRL